MQFTIPAVIEKITTLKDKSIKVNVETSELTPEAMLDVMRSYGKSGYFTFSEIEFKQDEIELPEIPEYAKLENEKTPSERLRSVLYVLYMQEKPNTDFNQYYRFKLEEIIKHFKDKLK